MKTMDRRHFMQRTGLTGLTMLTAGLAARRALADPDPPADAKAPGAASSPEPDIYSFQVAGMDAFVVHDGALGLPGIQPTFAPEGSKEEVEKALRGNFLPTDHVALSMNVLVVKSKEGVVVFDTGCGAAFGGAGGKLMRGLNRIGVSPTDVKVVFITHAHMDHIGGLLDAAKSPMFTSARLIAAKPEVEFWTSEKPDLSGMRTPPETKAQLAAGAREFLGAVKSSLELKEPGAVTSDVELLSAPGHTPGHSLYKIGRGDDALLVIGDAVHIYGLQFAHPDWTMAYDVNPAKAVSTRRKLFKEAAASRTTVLGYHMPFPGIGHVRESGKAFEWVPRPWVV